MSHSEVQFDIDMAEVVNSSEYHKGELIRGCRVVDAISNVESDVRSVFDVNKPARSIETNVSELRRGHLVDLKYKKSRNSVNTPYRVVEAVVSEEEYNETFDANEHRFKILCEPIIQNAALVLLCGNIRKYDNNNTTVIYETVYYKRNWDTPQIEGFENMKYPSEFFDVGFEEKDRQLNSISIVFDEIIAKCVGIESELTPIII